MPTPCRVATWFTFVLGLTALCGCVRDNGMPRTALWTFKNKEKTPRLHDPVRMHLAHAQAAEKGGALSQARRSYEYVLDEDPRSVDAILGLARINQMSGMPRQAEYGFKRALALKPQNSHVLHSLGQFYAAEERWSEAIEALNAAALAAPGNARYRYHLGVALARAGDLNGAFQQFERTVGRAEAHYNIGYILQEQGRLAQAQQQYQQALALRPDLENAQRMLDEVREKLAPSYVARRGAPPQRPPVRTAAAARPSSRPAASRQMGNSYRGTPQPAAAHGDPFLSPRTASQQPVNAQYSSTGARGGYDYRGVPTAHHVQPQPAGYAGPGRRTANPSGRDQSAYYSRPSTAPSGTMTPQQIEQWQNQSRGW